MFNKLKEKFEDKITETKAYYGYGISETLSKFTNEINKLLVDREFFDEDFFDDFEETLIELDIMPNLAITLRDKLESRIYNKRVSKKDFDSNLYDVVAQTVTLKEEKLEVMEGKTNIWLVIGVNGVGKTTSISKLINKNKQYDPLIAAADTFRAGAIEQINEWAKRLEVDIVKTHQGHAPSAVIYETMDRVVQEKRQLTICDTAGRLHNKDDLMNELAKIKKIITDKADENTVIKTILVLDGTAGKNTIEQARVFNEITDVDGVIVTKLDSGGKAGMIINIAYELATPLYYLTTGESVEDIKEFNKEEYLKGLFNKDEN